MPAAKGLKLRARVGDQGLVVEQHGIEVVCDKKHRSVPGAVYHLPHNQKRPYRHVCAGCAYEKGYADGLAAAKDETPAEEEEHDE